MTPQNEIQGMGAVSEARKRPERIKQLATSSKPTHHSGAPPEHDSANNDSTNRRHHR
jgi:hypothetical protein